MENSMGSGYMAVFAVSGGVVFLAMQIHKRILSNFMKKMEYEIKNSTGSVKVEVKKKVRFADNMVEVMAEEWPTTAAALGQNHYNKNLETMPLNLQVLCKGILKHRNLRGEI